MRVIKVWHIDDAVLYKHSELITKKDNIDWNGMINFCKQNGLRWLALPQIWISKSWFVAYFLNKRNIVINPVIGKKTLTEVISEEKCASLWKDDSYQVKRNHSIIANYSNKKWVWIPYPDSIVFQHEYDHLNGILLNTK